MRIALSADHAGYQLKDELVAWLREQGHEVEDLGTNGAESVDYPEYGAKLARVVGSGGAEFYDVTVRQPNSEVVINDMHGVLILALDNGRYAWSFENTDHVIADAGSGDCH